ncbi:MULTISPECIES: hypothetical protein [unclassified Sporosarcina]|uniref:hypothetical protein n=1 Tax=unclassified Sporosarcina TaxID=2647733 RepID=UPI00130452F4|nr:MULTISPECIES: hypothetical protein [unclassified Sporosarcina]
MLKKILIILTMVLGGGMFSVTINSLGDQGNKIMHLVGGLLWFVGILTFFQLNRKG